MLAQALLNAPLQIHLRQRQSVQTVLSSGFPGTDVGPQVHT